MLDILLIGAGGHAAACIDVIEAENRFKIIGLLGDKSEVGTDVCGYQVIGTDEDLPQLRKLCKHALVAVGQLECAKLRIDLYEQAKAQNFVLPSVVAPTAVLSKTANMGEGSILMHGVVVNSRAVIGRNCIINTKALVEHDAIIGNHSHISTGVIINGSTEIGYGCFVGSGSVLKNGISIGHDSIIPMGSVLKANPD